MAHKTFISYKYDEAQQLRDDIIKKLGDDATYYTGERSESPDLTDFKTETIKKHLSDMIINTTVMIVIVSQHMLQSKWMEWEIKYALRNQSRGGITHYADGIVCVIQKDPLSKYFSSYNRDNYKWAKDIFGQWDKTKLFDVINNNRNNKKNSVRNDLSENYIDIVTEEAFLRDPKKFINEAFEKCQNKELYDSKSERGHYPW